MCTCRSRFFLSRVLSATGSFQERIVARTVEIGVQPRGGLVQHLSVMKVTEQSRRMWLVDVVPTGAARRGAEMRQIGEAVQMQKAEQAGRATGRLA